MLRCKCVPLCSLSQLAAAYISATTGAVVTALGLKSLAKVLSLDHLSSSGFAHLRCIFF